jgi:hypothetical protein
VSFSIGRADPEQVVDRLSVVWRRRGHHRLVCMVRIGVRRNDQQKDLLAADPEHFEGVGWLQAVSVEANRSSSGQKSSRGLRPFGEVLHHAVNGAQAHR